LFLPWIQPDLVQQVENDLQSIMAGGTARDVDILFIRPSCELRRVVKRFDIYFLEASCFKAFLLIIVSDTRDLL